MTSLDFNAGSLASLPYPNGTQILGYLSTGEPVLGIFPYGSSDVVFIGDTNTLEEVPQPFTDNYLSFFLGPGRGCGAANRAPIPDAGGPYTGDEGAPLSLDASASYDPDGDALSFRWDFDNDGTADSSWSPSPVVTHTWGDDYSGVVKVEVSDNKTIANATATVTILNIPPRIDSLAIPAVNATATLRIAGEKWHDVSAYLSDGSSETLITTLTRQPGKPQECSFNLSIGLAGNASARLAYTPHDDTVNGQPNGATPAWLTFTFDSGPAVGLHHTFNVRHPETWNWTLSLNSLLAGRNITFTATATDPGSDDLTFTWDWGDGTPATAKTYFNDGIGPDPNPSVGGTYPFTATDLARHAFRMAGCYQVRLTVSDDDGGSTETVFTVSLP